MSDKGGSCVKLEELAFSILSKLQSLIRWITSAVSDACRQKRLTELSGGQSKSKFHPIKAHQWSSESPLMSLFLPVCVFLPSMPQIATNCVPDRTFDSNVVRCTSDLTLLSRQVRPLDVLRENSPWTMLLHCFSNIFNKASLTWVCIASYSFQAPS